jgi:serine phosphatase RsbU (regulator of sigma subunit)
MRLLFLIISVFNVLSLGIAQETSEKKINGNITISSDDIDVNVNLNKQFIINDSLWKYTFIDNLNFASIDLVETELKSVVFPLGINRIDEIGFKGIAWFRNTIVIDASQTNKVFDLNIEQTGASEIYIDGKLIQKFGKVAYLSTDENLRDPNHIPLSISFSKPGKHTIAIRYSNFYGLKYSNHYDNSHKWLSVIIDHENSIRNKVTVNALQLISTILMGIFTGSFLILAIINLIFYLFYKKEKSNLFFSFFSFFTMLMFLLPFFIKVFPNPKIYFLIDNAVQLVSIFSVVYLMKLIFYFAYPNTPKRYNIYLILCLLALIAVFINYNLGNQFSILVYCVIYFDLIIICFRLFLKKYDVEKRKRKVTLWIVIALVVLAIIMLFIEPYVSLIIFILILLSFILPALGFIFIVPVFMIVKQAKRFATLNTELEKKLIEVQSLSEKTIAQEIEKQQLLENQNKLLEEQVKQRTIELSHKNQEITDSIQYASRIQKALLVNTSDIEQGIVNQFILFKPKDIVSGDFYFYATHKHYVFLAAADCTGHGVPGSLMSMIGHEKLKLAIANSDQPGEILTYLNNSIKDALKQNNELDATRDGMDIALVRIDFSKNEVVYSGANRPIWLIRNINAEIEEIKATKKAIGGFTDTNQYFEQHVISLNKDDSFYLFSDGYADQFGQNGKKLMTKKFKEILLSISSLGMNEQKKYLDDFIENWRSGIEQIDDILVIGVKL